MYINDLIILTNPRTLLFLPLLTMNTEDQLLEHEPAIKTESKLIGSLVDRVISFSNHQKLLTTLIENYQNY